MKHMIKIIKHCVIVLLIDGIILAGDPLRDPPFEYHCSKVYMICIELA